MFFLPGDGALPGGTGARAAEGMKKENESTQECGGLPAMHKSLHWKKGGGTHVPF